ncbi:hypothetical protein [Niallia circulans]|uniref:Uncharacterized protein n=1 Tax=Niallia circulans TaxID=1397 RepID=A0A941JP19_NIACI|nr:hypothetical protein [Niallia circulans]MCB5235540.1 hypothetical protein [Niallia circulans]
MYTEKINFNAFMSRTYKEEKKLLNEKNIKSFIKWGTVVPVIGQLATKTAFAAEAVPATAMDTIAHAFDPLIDLMVGLSLPIAGVMITGGALLIMIGQKDYGYKLMMNCSLGYVLVNLSPLFLSLLADVGKAI